MNLTQWLETRLAEAGHAGRAVRKVRTFRVSSATRDALQANALGALLLATDYDDEVAAMRALGAEFLVRDDEGAAFRARYGALDLRMDMLPGDQTSTALIGHLVVIGETMFVLMATTAAASNLDDAAHSEDRGNAAVTVLREIVRAYGRSTLGRTGERLALYAHEPSRLARNRQHAENFLATLTKHRVVVTTANHRYDMLDARDVAALSEVLASAAKERDAINTRYLMGKIAILLEGGVPESIELVAPFTHEAARVAVDDGHGKTVEVVDQHRLAARPGAGGRLSAVVRAIISAADELEAETGEPAKPTAIAIRVAGAHQLLAVGSKVANSHGPVLISQLDDPGQALRSMFAERYRTAWRTGLLPWKSRMQIGDPSLRDRIPHTVDDEGNTTFYFEICCPVPDGVDLADDEWDRLVEALEKRSPRAGRSATGRRRPFRLTTWTDGAVRYETSVKVTNLYTLFAHTTDEDGKPAAKKLLSVNAQRVGRALGEAFIELAATLETGGMTIAMPRRGPAPPAAERTARAAELETLLRELEAQLRGNLVLQTTAAANGDTDKLAMLGEIEGETRASISEARSALDALIASGTEPTDMRAERTDVALSTLEEVGAALVVLSATDGTVPPELVRAMSGLTGRTLRIAPVDAGARCEVTVRLPTRDGTPVHHTVSVTVPNSMRGQTAIHHAHAIAEARMWNGEPWDTIGERWGIDGTGKTNSFTTSAIKRWLANPDGELKHDRRTIGSADLRRIILAAPAPIQRAVFGVLTGREHQLIAEGMSSEYLGHLTATYTNPDLAWGETWIGMRHERPRAILDHLVSAPLDAGLPIDVVARRVSVSLDEVVSWGADQPFPGSRKNERPRRPAIAERTWQHRDGTARADRRLRLRRCPHADCAGRGPNARSRGAALRATALTQVLWVPELLDGLVCPECRRMPSNRAVVFPETYLVCWNKGQAAGGTSRSGTTIDPD